MWHVHQLVEKHKAPVNSANSIIFGSFWIRDRRYNANPTTNQREKESNELAIFTNRLF